MVDRVQPLKIEDTATGGDDVDAFPTAVDRNEDYIDCRGTAIQNATSNDDQVRTERDASNNLVLVDPVAGPRTLNSLTTGGFDINNIVFDVAGCLVYDEAGNVVTRT